MLISIWLVLAAQASYETPPTMKVSAIAPAELLASEHYTLDEQVESDGYWNLYRFHTDYGEFEAAGNLLLHVRAREIEAITELKKVNEAQVVGEATLESMQELGTSVVTAATQPRETALGIGDGVKRLFGRYRRSGRRVGERVSSSSPGSDASTARKMGGAGGAIGKSMLGISSAERRWAKQLGVDPYSRNEVLRHELRRVATFEAAGRITTDLIVPVPAILSLTKDVSNLVWERDPGELMTLNEERLDAMDVSKDTGRRLRLNDNYTLSWETILVASLFALQEAPGLERFVARAADAQSEDEAAFYSQSAALLETLHREHGTVLEVVPGVNAIARLPGDRIIYVVPVDQMVWTQELETYVDEEVVWMSEHHPDALIEVRLTGRSSDRVKQELEKRGWTVRDESIRAFDR